MAQLPLYTEGRRGASRLRPYQAVGEAGDAPRMEAEGVMEELSSCQTMTSRNDGGPHSHAAVLFPPTPPRLPPTKAIINAQEIKIESV